jgi:hypothetical protein
MKYGGEVESETGNPETGSVVPRKAFPELFAGLAAISGDTGGWRIADGIADGIGDTIGDTL